MTNQPTSNNTKVPWIRILFSGILFLGTLLLSSFLGNLEGPFRGAANALQVHSSNMDYALSHWVQQNYSAIPGYIMILGTLLIWGPYFYKTFKKQALPLGICLMVGILSGCSPYKTPLFEEIDTNETAWVIPLTGDNKSTQQKFDSVAYLESRKVAAKRIELDQISVDVGRMPGDIQWKPAVRVVKVNRSLVTREWTDNENTGSAKKHEGIPVVTKDNIQLTVGLTITALIEEEDASTYLYYHGPRTLVDVLDQNIRSFAVADLTGAFSKLNLSDAQEQGKAIYEELFTKAKAEFKLKGITIQYLGNAEGMTFRDPNVQTAINAKFIAEQSIKTAEQENKAQAVRNELTIAKAKAQADAAQMLMVQKEATQLQTELEVKKMEATAQVTAAEKWNGQLPANIVPSNYPMLLNLSGASATKPIK